MATLRDLVDGYASVERDYYERCCKTAAKEAEKIETDSVFRPSHYARYTIEPITFIEANHLPFDVGNVVKYVMRYDAKGGMEDLRKARRYIDIIIERLDRETAVENGADAHDVWKETI